MNGVAPHVHPPDNLALIVEANLKRGDILQSLVREMGFQPVVARNGDDAIPFFQRVPPPQLALINALLPRLDGVALVRRIRALGLGVPILLFAPIPSVVDSLKQYDFGPFEVVLTSTPMAGISDVLRKLVPKPAPVGRRLLDEAAVDLRGFIHQFAQDLIAQFDVAMALVLVPWGNQRLAGVGLRPERLIMPAVTPEPLLALLLDGSADPVVLTDLKQSPIVTKDPFPSIPFRGVLGMVLSTNGPEVGYAVLADFRPLTLDAVAVDRFGALTNAASAEIRRAALEQRAKSQLEDLQARADSQREDAEARIAALTDAATKDVLTGLVNRRGGEEALAREVARAARLGMPAGLVMLDIDHFKRVNDRHGHAVGDDTLRSVAATIERLRRASDLAIRWGGDEFIVLLPHDDTAASHTFAERLRAAVEALRIGHARVTISAGVGELSAREPIEATLVEVDRRLYEAKESGGNAVR